ncbi:MAG: HesA/MoeB/ThiF family protein [Deltaproteobacteria bacterium]|nr:HesA/MoeB/ThiF family protein [Deltaproteobacteria bacterium]
MNSGRYARQVTLPGVGVDGQERLASARVLCVGAGGLGSPAALYLTAAGIGTVGLIDGDVVMESNLPRQVLYDSNDLGRPKTQAAAAKLRLLNPQVKIVTHDHWLEPENAQEVFRGYDVIVDGSDNFATKYLVNDAAAALGLPVVWGSISGHEGRVSVFCVGRGPCYRCVYPEPPSAPVGHCGENGVLGALAGVIGAAQALEAQKLCFKTDGVFRPLLGRMLVVDGATFETFVWEIQPNSQCAHGSKGLRAVSRLEPGVMIVDVRPADEWRKAHVPGALSWPLEALERGKTPPLERSRPCVVYCQYGAQTWRAVELLEQQGFRDVRELLGGFTRWSHESSVAFG